jgi:hypothetical protein
VALDTKNQKSIYFCNIFSYIYRQPGIAGVDIVQIANSSMLLSVYSVDSVYWRLEFEIQIVAHNHVYI